MESGAAVPHRHEYSGVSAARERPARDSSIRIDWREDVCGFHGD
jgi:hypothetical protein